MNEKAFRSFRVSSILLLMNEKRVELYIKWQGLFYLIIALPIPELNSRNKEKQ